MEYTPKKNIRKYLSDNSSFLIPAYQRGYKWGVKDKSGRSNAKILIEDILRAYNQSKQREYFIQGVTGFSSDKDNCFYLVDGQQRTTTLFLLIALLADETQRKELLFRDNELKLNYFGKRTITTEFLSRVCLSGSIEKPRDTQDIHFLIQSMNDIKALLPTDDIKRAQLLLFILEKVCLFQIDVRREEAANVFSMMNGNKAFMKVEELIKADYLSGLSRLSATSNRYETDNSQSTLQILQEQMLQETAQEWRINTIRSRLAREWDKWVYWWNRPDVSAYFRLPSGHQTGWILDVYTRQKNKPALSREIEDVNTSFERFRELVGDEQKTLEESFELLRRIQKRIEDIYSSYDTYNHMGLLMNILDRNEERMDALLFFIEHKDNEAIETYTRYRLAGIGHTSACKIAENTELDADEQKSIQERIDTFIRTFEGEVYTDNGTPQKEATMRYLFYCNIMADNKRGCKFEFFYQEEGETLLKPYWSSRSLEHIWPKSRAGEGKEITREELESHGVSEHMLGNLAFLHGSDNSVFNDMTPFEKRMVYFDLDYKTKSGRRIYSRGMLHTMAAFGGKEWESGQIAEIIKNRQKEELRKLRALYGK